MAPPLDRIVTDEKGFGLRVVRNETRAFLVLHWHQTVVWTSHGLQFIGQLLPRNDGDPGKEWLVVWEGYDSEVHQFETRTDDLAEATRLVEESYDN
jgi:hypothetical protein